MLYLARIAEKRLSTLVINYVPDTRHVRTVALRCVEDVLLGARRSDRVIARTLATLVVKENILPLARSQVIHTFLSILR